ncbi:MAG: DUF4870 domain-containing protein [Microthrixaceae bacterium]
MEETYDAVLLTDDEKNMAMLAHLAILSAYVTGIPVVGPLIVWLIKKDESAFVDEQGKEAVNFAITIVIWGIVTFLLCFVLVGFVLIPVVAIASIVLPILACLKAKEGIPYRYPFCIRLIG